jgi:N-acetylmuramoyl-L-alanine amidase
MTGRLPFHAPNVRGLLLLFIVLLATPFSAVAQSVASDLRDITVSPSDNSATITFLVAGRVRTVVVEPKEQGVAEVRMKSMRAEKKALGSALPKPGVVAIKAHIERTDVLVTDVAFTREVTGMKVVSRDSARVVVLVTLGDPLSSPSLSSSRPFDSSSSRSLPADTVNRDRKRKWALGTIIIDAGHGGKDPGTTGLEDVQEKDVVLAVAKHLRKELQSQMPGVKVVMTRSDDTFVELSRRGEIANEKGGRLFISIHCNAMPEKPSPKSGFECYILRPGRSDDATRVAVRENSAIIYEAGTSNISRSAAEVTIVASMAQSTFVRNSEEAANAIRQSMRSSVAIPDRGVHQAGFYVLVGASMPAVLLELGYLTNEDDVAILKSASQQKKIAKAIAKGIRAYQKGYATTLK